MNVVVTTRSGSRFKNHLSRPDGITYCGRGEEEWAWEIDESQVADEPMLCERCKTAWDRRERGCV